MAKTLANLQTGTRVYLDEANASDFLDSEVTRSINYAYQDVIGHVMEVYEDFFTTPASSAINISTVANQQEYALDPTIIKPRRVEINYDPDDPNAFPIKAVQIRIDDLPRQLSSINNGSAGLFSAGYYVYGPLSNQKIGFSPPPTETGTNAVQVWGIQLQSDLVNSTDTANIPFVDRFGYLIELKAAALLLRKGQQQESFAAQYIKEFAMGIDEMKVFLKDRQADGAWLVVDELYEDTIFDHPL